MLRRRHAPRACNFRPPAAAKLSASECRRRQVPPLGRPAAPRAHPPKPAGHRGTHRVRASGRTRAGPSSGRQSTSSGTPAAAYRVALTERSKSTDESDTSMSRRMSGRCGRTLGLVDCFGARFSRFVRRGRLAAYATEATRCRCRCSSSASELTIRRKPGPRAAGRAPRCGPGSSERVLQALPHSVGSNSWRATSNPGYLPPPNTPWPEGTSLDLLREDLPCRPCPGTSKPREAYAALVSLKDVKPPRGGRFGSWRATRNIATAKTGTRLLFKVGSPGCLEFEVNVPAIAASGQRGRWRYGSARR